MVRVFVLAISLLAAGAASVMAQENSPAVPEALDFTVKSIDGADVNLADYQGKVLVVVNVASKCGMTPQYEGLEKLYREKSADGLAVLGFPCNQFGSQEPGTAAEIKSFCQDNYDVTFDLFAKTDVNGDNANDFYAHLTGVETGPAKPGRISWNFEKFVIDRSGNVVGRFGPRTSPDDREFQAVINKALQEGK